LPTAQTQHVRSLPSQLISQTSNTRPGDDVDAAIWSTLEVSVATVCACLPAIRALLSKWFPSLFDTSNISSYSSRQEEKPDLEPGNLTVLNTPTRSRILRLQKIGPSYNKRVVVTPDDELLSDNPQIGEFRDIDRYGREHRGQETKVWINPHFDPEGNVVEWQGPLVENHQVERQICRPSTENTSLWLLEGPMIGDGDQVGVVGKARSMELGNIGIAVSTGEELVKAEYTSGRPRLQRIWASKSLPPLPTGGRPEDWV
jgi:hypothetical protein